MKRYNTPHRCRVIKTRKQKVRTDIRSFQSESKKKLSHR